MPRPRASSTARGYGWQHRKTKATYQPAITAGNGWCTEPLCLHATRWIPPHTPWDLAHNRQTGSYRGPAHRKCNRAEGATYGNKQRGRARHQPRQATPAATTTWHSQTW